MKIDSGQYYVVYVLADYNHTDFTHQGYVGVTRLGREKKRMSEHRYACRTHRYGRNWTFDKMITLFVGDLDGIIAAGIRWRKQSHDD